MDNIAFFISLDWKYVTLLAWYRALDIDYKETLTYDVDRSWGLVLSGNGGIHSERRLLEQ
jgi:hypothetical protein